MKTKRILAFILAMLVSASFFCGGAGAAEENETEKIDGLLKTLEIIEEGSEKAAEDTITRMEFLSVVMRALKLDSGAAENRKIFFDIEASDENSKAVSAAFDLGIIKGGADGRFCPDDNITFGEAVVIAVRAAGCENIAALRGGYFSGYLAVAKNIGLLDNISAAAESELYYSAAQKMVYNMLNAKLAEVKGDELILNDNSSFMKKLYNIEKETGIVDANSYANIYGGARCDENKISIDGAVYDVEEKYNGKFIGEKVEFYYEKEPHSNNGHKIIYMKETQNSFFEADFEDIENLNGEKLEYYAKSGKLAGINISPNALTLENGVKTTVPKTGYNFGVYGSIKTVDNNSDGRADVVLISSAKLGRVKSVSDEKIYFSNKSAFNIDINEYETVKLFNAEGNEVLTGDIKKDDIAEIYAAADKSYAEIYILNNTKTVKISKLKTGENGGYTYYVMEDSNGEELRTVRDFNSLHSDNFLEVGGEYNFSLDLKGRAAFVVEKSADDGFKYGYIAKWGIGKKGVSKDVTLRMLTAEGKLEDLVLAENVRNNSSETTEKNADIYAGITERQVVRYSLNAEGLINQIEFASSDLTSKGFKKGASTASGRNGTTRYYKTSGLLGPEIALDAKTLVFSVPSADNSSDEKLYYMGDMNTLASGGYYPNTVSYLYGDDIYSKAVVRESNVKSVERDSSRMLVSKIEKIYDADENSEKYSVVGLESGKERTLVLRDDDIMQYSYNDEQGNPQTAFVEEGDIIRYETDSQKRVSFIKIVYDESAGVLLNTSENTASYNSDTTHIAGQIAKKQDKYISLEGSTVPVSYKYGVTKDTYIYEYDKNARGEKARVISEGDIISLEDVPDMRDKAVLVTSLGNLPLLVIYK